MPHDVMLLFEGCVVVVEASSAESRTRGVRRGAGQVPGSELVMEVNDTRYTTAGTFVGRNEA